MVLRFRVTLSDDDDCEQLEMFSEATGASYGEIIEVLVRDYLGHLLKDVGEKAIEIGEIDSSEVDEGEEEEEDEEEEGEEDEGEEEEEEEKED